MAAGVISLALAKAGQGAASAAFLAVAALTYLELLVREGAQLVRSPSGYWRGLAEPRPTLGAFAFTISSSVIGARLAGLGAVGPAAALTGVGACAGVGWAVVTTRRWGGWRRRPLWLGEAGGTWLLWPVGVLGAGAGLSSLEVAAHIHAPILGALGLALWAAGVLLYLPLAAALVWRLVHRPKLAEVGPSYWILSGAASLGGLSAALASADPSVATLWRGAASDLAPAGAGLLALAAAVLPLPVAVTATRIRHRQHLLGAPKEYWAAVFPIGMGSLTCLTISAGGGWLASLGRLVALLAVAAFLAELARSVWGLLFPISAPPEGQLPSSPEAPTLPQ